MKKSVLIFLILVLVSGCNNPYSLRLTSDYFPLELGNEWVYILNGNSNYKTESEVIALDSLYRVEFFGEDVAFERTSGKINRVYEVFATYQGKKISFGTIHEPFLNLPFIEGEEWDREFTFSTISQGDTISKYIYIEIDSVTVTSLNLSWKNFDNVYRIFRTRIEDEDTLYQYEWYAPNIGLVKKYIPQDSTSWELESFSLNDSD